jgi:hypothetical protein
MTSINDYLTLDMERSALPNVTVDFPYKLLIEETCIIIRTIYGTAIDITSL